MTGVISDSELVDDDEVDFFNDYLQNVNENIVETVKLDVSADDFEYFLSDEHDLRNHGILVEVLPTI